jgi:hypothetical protein
MATSCYRCGASVRIEGTVGRRTTCPECDADLHCCMDCRQYDEGAPHACREPHADHVLDKEASNACELFQLGDGASRRKVKSRAARDALAALFGEAPAAADDDPRSALDALFGKK